MGIQKDAEELLVYIYKQKIQGNEMPTADNLVILTNWTKDRVIFALQYLVDKALLAGRVVKSVGSTKPQFVMISDISPEGIDIIENPDKFKRHFNHTINLVLYKFSWGASQR